MVLSYRHGFHVGNAGDCVKHSVLALILTSLVAKKDKPLLFIDTHAAAGSYSLQSPSTPNTEYRSGIARLWTPTAPPLSLAPFLSAVRAINGFTAQPQPATAPYAALTSTGSSTEFDAAPPSLFALPESPPAYPPSAYALSSLTRYPGSPSLFLHLRRPQDRMLAYELHPTERANLSAFLSSPQQRSVPGYPHYPASTTPAGRARPPRPSRVMDGSGFLSFTILPQPERRGVVFVDPPYELESDYDDVSAFVRNAHRRWSTATYAVWYPLLQGKERLSERMRDALQATRTHPNNSTAAALRTVHAWRPHRRLLTAHPPRMSAQASRACWTSASLCATSWPTRSRRLHLR